MVCIIGGLNANVKKRKDSALLDFRVRTAVDFSTSTVILVL